MINYKQYSLGGEMFKYLLITILLTAPAFALEICQKTKCRPPANVQIPINETSFQNFDLPLSPYVDNSIKGVIVIPGDTVHVKVTIKNGEISLIEYSEKPSDLEITFHKLKMEKNISSLLQIKNNMKKSIVYKALVNAPTNNWRHFHTSSCPVRAGLTSFENWPHPVSQIVLMDVRYAKANETSCKKY